MLPLYRGCSRISDMKTDLEKAKYLWTRLTKLDGRDDILTNSLLEVATPKRPQEGWLKACRESLLIGQSEVAERLNLSRQAYAKLESNESNSVISLESLKKAAEAMDCELVYWIRPKKRKPFSTLLWELLIQDALRVYRTRVRSKEIKPMVLARVAANLLKDPAFRRKMNWTRNTGSVPY